MAKLERGQINNYVLDLGREEKRLEVIRGGGAGATRCSQVLPSNNYDGTKKRGRSILIKTIETAYEEAF